MQNNLKTVHMIGQIEKCTQLPKGSDALKRKRMRKYIYFLFMSALFTHDLIIANLPFVFAAVFTDFNFSLTDNLQQIGILFIFSLITISFFPSYNLYSYHLIFFKKRHLRCILLSFVYSLLTFGILFSFVIWPLSGTILVILYTVLGLILTSRFFLEKELNILRAVGFSFLLLWILMMLSNGDEAIITTSILGTVTIFPICIATSLLSRQLLIQQVFNKLLRKHFRRQIAVIGSDKEAETIINHIIKNNAPFWVTGTIDRQGNKKLSVSVPKNPLGRLKELPNILTRQKVDELIVTDENIDKQTFIFLLNCCTSERITVWFSPKLMPVYAMKLPGENFCGLPMIMMRPRKSSYLSNKIKHGLDTLVAIPLFISLLPLFLVISIAIKLKSPGPVLYKSNMVGKKGRPFTMYKFRSMTFNNNSDDHKKYVTKWINDELTNDGEKKQIFRIMDDPRVTPIGKFLRKFSLDELPQIINAIKGEMSLVGPRPCLPYEYDTYKDWHKKRLSIRPGITGLWQVRGRATVPFEDMVLLDLYYIYNRDLLLDLTILLETLFVLIERRGAY
jgi:exopolysaccharide biosynthesis polyprenyl glycosylphosphotransferase